MADVSSINQPGVDLIFIRWFAKKSPEERLRILQYNVTSIIMLSNATKHAWKYSIPIAAIQLSNLVSRSRSERFI